VLETSLCLDAEQWTARGDDYAVRVESFVAPHVKRAQAGELHPVWDLYVRCQKAFASRAAPLRAALLARCDLLLQTAGYG